MTTILDNIVATKRQEVADLKKQFSSASLLNQCAEQEPTRGFFQQLQIKIDRKQPGIIAEIKKASPSKGIICDDFDALKLAQSYQNHGADCLSVLTDEPFFQGSAADFITIRKQCQRPMLRKDFMIDECQIIQSRAMGADCVLLILAVLDDVQLFDLYQVAQSLNMDILLETHDHHEIDRAIKLNPKFIGVNNRNLKTFDTDIQTSIKAKHYLGNEINLVAESGISNAEHLQQFMQANIYAFLIGEYFMKQPSPGEALSNLVNSASHRQ